MAYGPRACSKTCRGTASEAWGPKKLPLPSPAMLMYECTLWSSISSNHTTRDRTTLRVSKEVVAVGVGGRALGDDVTDLLDGHLHLVRKRRTHRALVLTEVKRDVRASFSLQVCFDLSSVGLVTRSTVEEEDGELESRSFIRSSRTDECSCSRKKKSVDGKHDTDAGVGTRRSPQLQRFRQVFELVVVLKFQRDFARWNLRTTLVTTNKELQGKSSIANIITPPLADAALTNWLSIDPFLPQVNNLQECGTDATCTANQARRKANFLKLKAAHFFASLQDDIQAPWQSCVLSKYSTVASLDEIESKFSDFTIIDMKDTVEYTKDLYGLKTLDTAGALHIHQVPDVPHDCWLFDYTSLATKIPCKHEPVYNAQIYPLLV